MALLRQLVRRALRLPVVLTRADWRALVVFGLLLTVGIVGIIQAANKGYASVPAKGGEITEGIVADSQSAVEKEIETLTHAPLIKFDHQGAFQPSLAKSWEIKEDGKLYTFELVDGFPSSQAAEVLKNQKNGLSQLEINTPSPSALQLRLKQPFSPLLSDLTKPIFPVGFYELKERNTNKLVLRARQTPLGEPLVQKVTIELYSSPKALSDALSQRRIDAAVLSEPPPKDYTSLKLKLPRRQIVFLNLARPVFKDRITRQNLKTNATVTGLAFELTTTSAGNLQQTAQEFADQANSRGAVVRLHTVDPQLLRQEIIAKRDFDALLMLVDFGRDPDPYSFWHSSQIESGQNLAGFVNKKVDRILEDARLTTDQGKRQELYRQLEAILSDEVPAIFLNQEELQYNISTRVKGVVIGQGVTPADRFGNIKDWYVKVKRVRK